VRLELFSSKRGNPESNLVCIQARDLDMLPTVLVCPLLSKGKLTFFRPFVHVNGIKRVVCIDLVRPIRRKALVDAGMLDAADSHAVMHLFATLLAR